MSFLGVFLSDKNVMPKVRKNVVRFFRYQTGNSHHEAVQAAAAKKKLKAERKRIIFRKTMQDETVFNNLTGPCYTVQ